MDYNDQEVGAIAPFPAEFEAPRLTELGSVEEVFLGTGAAGPEMATCACW